MILPAWLSHFLRMGLNGSFPKYRRGYALSSPSRESCQWEGRRFAGEGPPLAEARPSREAREGEVLLNTGHISETSSSYNYWSPDAEKT